MNNNIEAEINCIGCGAVIQTEHENKSGYVPKSILEKYLKDENPILDQRCFKLRNYNEIQDVEFNNDDFIKMLSNISETDSLILYVVDIFNFSSSIINSIKRFVGHNNIILVANKIDVLPKSLKGNKIKTWIRKSIKEYNIDPLDIILTSGKNGKEIPELINKLEQYRKAKSVYVVGVTNVGKSTLINQIIKYVTSEKKDIITTSKFPGTTLDIIKIPFDNTSFLIDTPGIIYNDQMSNYIDSKTLKYVNPQKELKPKTYQLKEMQTLFIGALGRFDYIKGNNINITTYFDNNLMIHRTKLDKADDFFEKNRNSFLTPTTKDENQKFKKYEYKLSEKTDIVINGLGWINVSGPSIIAISVPEGVSVIIRKAMI